MYPTRVHVLILRDTVEKRARVSWYHLKWLYWHNFFTLEHCQASALLNAHVSRYLFPWMANWTRYK